MDDRTEPMPWPVDAPGTHWPRVYVIILSWNGKEDTLRCLRSVQEVDYPRYRVLVVDNASGDGSVEAIRAAFPAVELIVNESNLGFSAGNNEGVQYALQSGADYVLLLNNDTRVDRMVLTALVRAGEADPGVGLASPKVYYLDRPHVIYYGGARKGCLPLLPRVIGVGEEDHGQHEQLEEVDYVWGQAMFIKRQVIESIGLLDPQFFMYYEDLDYCLRAKRTGYKIVCVPAALVWHQVAKGTEGDYLTRWQYKVTSMWRFHRKHSRLGWPHALLLTAVTLVRITVRELARGNWRPLPQMARSWVRRRRQG
jgi:GT2 family glycosyltransferase